MNTGLLINALTGKGGTKQTPSELGISSNKSRFTTVPAGNVLQANTHRAVTTDNTCPIAQNQPINGQSQNFSRTLGGKMATKTSRNAQASNKTKGQDQSSGTFSNILPSQFLAVQESLTAHAVLDKATGANISVQCQKQSETQIPNKSSRLIAGSKVPKASSFIAVATKPITAKPNQPISAISKQDDKENKPIQSDATRSRGRAKIILPDTSRKHPFVGTSSEAGKDTPKVIQMSDNVLVKDGKLVNQKNSRGLLHKTYANNSKVAAVGKEPLKVDIPARPDSPKTQLLENLITAVQNKASDFEQKVLISRKKSASVIEKTEDNKADTDQKDHLGKVDADGKNHLGEADTSRKEHFDKVGINFKGHFSKAEATGKGDFDKTGTVRENHPDRADADWKGPLGKVDFSRTNHPDETDTSRTNRPDKAELSEAPGKGRIRVEDSSVESIAQKLSLSQVQVSAPQVKNHNGLFSNRGSELDTEQSVQVLVGSNTQIPITERSPVSTTTVFPKTADGVDFGASVSEQIRESIRSSLHMDNQQIVIRLNPPELGKVAITFREQDNDITGVLEVDKTQTRLEIQQTLPEVIQTLRDSGIQVKRLEVALSGQQEQNSFREQASTAGQDSWFGQQNSPNPDLQRNDMTYNEWLTDTSEQVDIGFDEPQDIFVDGRSISILA